MHALWRHLMEGCTDWPPLTSDAGAFRFCLWKSSILVPQSVWATGSGVPSPQIVAVGGRGFELWLLKVQKNWIPSISYPHRLTSLALTCDLYDLPAIDHNGMRVWSAQHRELRQSLQSLFWGHTCQPIRWKYWRLCFSEVSDIIAQSPNSLHLEFCHIWAQQAVTDKQQENIRKPIIILASKIWESPEGGGG